MPQYGGYCAYGTAEGRQVASVPSAFTIHEGKLYLHASTAERSLWTQGLDENLARADAHWPHDGN